MYKNITSFPDYRRNLLKTEIIKDQLVFVMSSYFYVSLLNMCMCYLSFKEIVFKNSDYTDKAV